MKKRIIAIFMTALLAVSAISLVGCDEEEKDLNKAKSWDYDGDGRLNEREQKDYEDYYRKAYEYERTH